MASAPPNTKPTIKQIQAFHKVLKGAKISQAMKEVGYSLSTSASTAKLTGSDGWQALLDQYLSDHDLTKEHKALLNSRRLDHMTFPPFNVDKAEKKDEEDEEGEENEGERHGEQLTDNDIRELLSGVNCTVRRIVHGDMARHVYFWSPDNKAKSSALDLAYKLKGRFIKEKDPEGENNRPSQIINILINAPNGGENIRHIPNREAVSSVASPSES